MQSILAIAYRFMCLYWRLLRPVTLGVTAVVTNDKGEVLLVRHTYRKGWFLPGGGVKRGESIEQALRRELFEEVGIKLLDDKPELFFGPYYRKFNGKHDHVFCYKVKNWEGAPSGVPNLEVAEAKFFAPTEIPSLTGELTQTKIAAFMERV